MRHFSPFHHEASADRGWAKVTNCAEKRWGEVSLQGERPGGDISQRKHNEGETGKCSPREKTWPEESKKTVRGNISHRAR